jgi:hypothetical protein
MARDYEAYRRRGAAIAAVVIDPPEQNAAMTAKLALPFPVLADPGGVGAIRPYDLWDEAEDMAKPAIVVLAPDGDETYRYVGFDFADRPDDDDVLAALDALALPPASGAIAPLPHLPPAPSPRAIKLHDLGPYLRGVRSAMRAMAGRARDEWDRAEARRTVQMADRYLVAQAATLRLTGER